MTQDNELTVEKIKLWRTGFDMTGYRQEDYCHQGFANAVMFLDEAISLIDTLTATQRDFCEKHEEDHAEGCCHCTMEKMDDQLTEYYKRTVIDSQEIYELTKQVESQKDEIKNLDDTATGLAMGWEEREERLTADTARDCAEIAEGEQCHCFPRKEKEPDVSCAGCRAAKAIRTKYSLPKEE